MNDYYYDLHIHSCLSPCGDNDSTPNNIAGMASLCGLNVIALTDHNTCKNCPAFFHAAKRYGIVPIGGAEVTTSEDIHVVFLFDSLDKTMAFDSFLDSKRIKIPNRADIFGDQFILDKDDNIVGIEENLLINATEISLQDTPAIAREYGGICYPAHIDRQSNGMIAVLGTFPLDLFNCYELNDKNNNAGYVKKYSLYDKKMVVSSDAHFLQNISEKENYFTINDEPYSGSLVRKRILELLK